MQKTSKRYMFIQKRFERYKLFPEFATFALNPFKKV